MIQEYSRLDGDIKAKTIEATSKGVKCLVNPLALEQFLDYNDVISVGIVPRKESLLR